MTTWEEIRDEVAGMLADGKPLEDVIDNLEKRKNEMAKENLLKAMDGNMMANVCPICNNPLRQYDKDFYVCEVCETYFDKNENIVLTEQEWLQTCDTEQLAEWIAKIVDCDCCPVKRKFCDDNPCKIRFAEWLKQPHTREERKK